MSRNDPAGEGRSRHRNVFKGGAPHATTENIPTARSSFAGSVLSGHGALLPLPCALPYRLRSWRGPLHAPTLQAHPYDISHKVGDCHAGSTSRFSHLQVVHNIQVDDHALLTHDRSILYTYVHTYISLWLTYVRTP